MYTANKAVSNKALTAIRRRFSAWITTFDDGPKLVSFNETNNENTTNRTGYSIVWEGGPYKWTYLAAFGGFDDFGFEVEPVEAPAGFYLEPVNHWSLNVYAD